MILSKVSLQGFKSFAKRIDLRFDGKITAVVGPNGCGKTNIVDAIRWGLGEQRPSVLRADRMENIIFGGAQSSRPVGMAEVSVTFDNSQHIIPIDYSEVVVTRRLYRSGESEYLLNKNNVRLKDIQDLIMDTGIGADAYSVIELKMVEDILSDKAEDRRKLLEEAAGVTKYKHRLKAAMRKLDATRADHIRVNDILMEVDRTVNSLKRQVQKAKRYQVLQEELQDWDLKRGRHLFQQIQDKLQPIQKNLAELQEQKEGRTTEITKEEADLEALRLKATEKEKALVESREQLAATVEKIHRRESDIRVAKERISSLTEAKERYTREIFELKKRLEDQKSHLTVAFNDREALQVKITSTGRLFNNKRKELEVFQQGLNFKRLDLNAKKKEIIDCLEEVNRLSGDETQLRAKIDNSQGRLERLDEQDQVFQDVRKRVDEARRQMDDKLRELRSEASKMQQSKDRLEGDIESTKDAIESGREQVYKDQSELDLLQGRLGFLKNILESHEGVADGAKKLLNAKADGLVGILADLIEVESDHQVAIETALGESTGYLLFRDTKQAFSAVNLLKRQGGGRVTMVCMDRTKGLSHPADRPSLPSNKNIIGWADELVQCDASLRPVMTYLLGDLLVVEDLDTADEVIQSFSQGRFRVATLAGELITGWGALHAGEEKGREVNIVGRRQQIEDLEKRIEACNSRLSSAQKQVESDQARLEVLNKKREEVIREYQSLTDKLSSAEKEQARNQFESENAEQGILNNGKERQTLLQEIEKGRESLENIRPRMDALLERRETLETASHQVQIEVDRLEEEEGVMENEVHQLNLSVVRLKGEAKNLDYDIERSESLIKEIEATLTQRDQEIVKADEQVEKYKEEKTQNEQALVDDFSEKNRFESTMNEREQSYQEMMEQIRTLEKEIRQVRRDRDEAADSIHQFEMQISDLEHEAKSLKDRLWESYEVDVTGLPLGEEPLDLDQADFEIDERRRKIKAMGPVNMAALEEYEQEKERLDFLNRQRDDLLSAENTLKETIKKINETARNRFNEVFTEVQKHFRETFTRFFNGGEADLRLPEGEDPLEAQVEIIARPAGKHFRDLDLLSGGERALTAISLLFALYLVKPSPFCILDEIDAPLDDANVERFTRVLAEFAEKTQFIMVTHNKMTMKAAQALYGVTMEEEGVSKIVSVKFDD